MSKPWNPNSPRLSAEAYAALSPAEKRALWRMRKGRRKQRSGTRRSLLGYWRETSHHRRMPVGGKAGLVLVGAACLGVAIGAYEAFGPRDVVADEVAVSETTQSVAPAPVMDARDRAWAERAKDDRVEAPAAQAVAGVRASFSYCKWGGGTNCVVDGDTFWIGGQKVRIADIDAPETHDYRCDSELELGERAARKLQALLNSGAVTMTSIDRNRDDYGRLLRNVSVNGKDVGGELVSAGLARWYRGHRRPWC